MLKMMFFDLGCTKKKKTNLESDEAFEDEIEAAKDIFHWKMYIQLFRLPACSLMT